MIEKLFSRRTELVVSLLSAAFFVLIYLDIVFKGTLFHFDAILHQWSLGWHTPALDKLIFVFTQSGSVLAMILYSLAILIYFIRKKERRKLYFYLSGMLGASALFSGIKEIVVRARPSSYIGDFHQQGYSFPSGHATMSMTFSLLLLLIFYPGMKKRNRKYLLAFSLLFPLAISFSRIYLGVHYFTDISAGMMLGVSWVMLMAWSFNFTWEKASPATRL